MTLLSNKSTNTSQVSLLITNLIPLLGVLFLSWNAASIVFLYWFENIIIGVFNIFKILKAHISNKPVRINNDLMQPQGMEPYIKIFLIPFFILHYGLFTFGHGVFISVMFGGPQMTLWEIAIAAISLTISHTISYYTNFLGKEEYKQIDPFSQMFAPYRRIIVTHVTIILSGFAVLYLQQALWALVVFVALKTYFDLVHHNKEHELLLPKEYYETTNDTTN